VTLLVVFSVVVPQYFLNAVILSDVHYCKHPTDVSDAFYQYDTQELPVEFLIILAFSRC